MASPVSWLDPRVSRYLLDSSRERVVLEIRKHWMASIGAWALLFLGVVVFLCAGSVPPKLVGLDYSVAAALGLRASWSIIGEFRDRFVVTDQRVFRVHGTFSIRRASIPLGRILDITVQKPLIGRIFNYGHFVFESAAQVQGLGLISYVRDIDRCDLILQRAIQRLGQGGPDDSGDDGT